MAVAGNYMAMLNEALGNTEQEWDGFDRPRVWSSQDTSFYTTPNTQGSKKIRNKNFCESEDIILVKAWLDTSIDAIPCIN
jgi:hypothetical protein